jgi:hypothetical protein
MIENQITSKETTTVIKPSQPWTLDHGGIISTAKPLALQFPYYGTSQRANQKLEDLEEQGIVNNYRPEFRTEDFEGPQILPRGVKAEKLSKLRTSLLNQDARKKSYRNSFFIGPLGSRPSDLLLWRALDNYKKEKSAAAPSNIVIVGRRDISCHFMARRLLRMLPAAEREKFAQDIEVVKNADFKNGNGNSLQTKPKIIFLNLDNLEGSVKAKHNGERQKNDIPSQGLIKDSLSGLYTHIGVDNLKYLYFDKVHDSLTEYRTPILDNLLSQLKSDREDPSELLGASYCRVGHDDESRTIDQYFEYRDFLGSSEALAGSEMAPIENVEYLATNIGETGVRFNEKYGRNEDFIQENVVSRVKKLREKGRERIVIRAHDTHSIDIVVSELKKAGIDAGWIYSTNGKKDQILHSDGENEAKSESERIRLIDRFGKDFHVLIHCGTLDGEEYPADAGFVFKGIDNDDNLESWIGPVNTFTWDEEYDPSDERLKRDLILLDRTKITASKRPAAEILNDIDVRHRDPYAVEARQKKGKTRSLDAKADADQKEVDVDQVYSYSAKIYGGDPQWLEFLDRELTIPDEDFEIEKGESRIDAKLRYLSSLVMEAVGGDIEGLNDALCQRILRGHQRSESFKRDVIEFALDLGRAETSMTDVVKRFPRIARIEDSAEAKARIEHIFENSEVKEKANKIWLEKLNTFYDQSAFELAAEFLLEKDWANLYFDHSLEETLSVILGAQESYLEDKNEGNKLFVDFLNFLSSKEKSLSSIMVAEAFPDKFNAEELVYKSNLTAELSYIESLGLVQENSSWVADLDRGTGVSNKKLRQKRILDFLYGHFIQQSLAGRRYPFRKYFSSAQELAFALNACQGVVDHPERRQEAFTLLDNYRASVNEHSNRVDDAIYYKNFPERFTQSAKTDSRDKVKAFITSIMTKPLKSNSRWNTLLISLPDEKVEIFTNFILRNSDLKKELSSKEKTIDLLETLQGYDIRDSKGEYIERRKRFKDFVAFLQAEYENFDPYSQITEIYPKIFDRKEALLTNPALAQREVETELERINDANTAWLDILDESLASTNSKLTRSQLIAEFFASRNNGKAFDDLAVNLKAVLACPPPSSKKARKAMSLNPEQSRQEFRDFVDYAVKKGLSLNKARIAQVLPEYFDFSEISDSQEFLVASINGLVEQSSKTTSWQDHLVNLAKANDTSVGDLIADYALANPDSLFDGECFSSQKALKDRVLAPLLAKTRDDKELFRSFLGFARERLNEESLDNYSVSKLGLNSYFDFSELATDDRYLRAQVQSRLNNASELRKVFDLFCNKNNLKAQETYLEFIKAQSPDLNRDQVSLAIDAINEESQSFIDFVLQKYPKFKTDYDAQVVQKAVQKIRDSEEHTVYQIWFDCLNDAAFINYDESLSPEERQGLMLRDFLATEDEAIVDDSQRLENYLLVLMGSKKELNASKEEAIGLFQRYLAYLKEADKTLPNRDMYASFPEAVDLFAELYNTDTSFYETTRRFIQSGNLQVRDEWFNPLNRHLGFFLESREKNPRDDSLRASLLAKLMSEFFEKNHIKFKSQEEYIEQVQVLCGVLEDTKAIDSDEAKDLFGRFRKFLSDKIGGPSRFEASSILGGYRLPALISDVSDHLLLRRSKDEGIDFDRSTPNKVVDHRVEKLNKFGYGLSSIIDVIQNIVGIDRENLLQYSQIQAFDFEDYKQGLGDILEVILPGRKRNASIQALGIDLPDGDTLDYDFNDEDTRQGIIRSIKKLVLNNDQDLQRRLKTFVEDYSVLCNFFPHLSDDFANYHSYDVYNLLDGRGLVQYKPDTIEYYQKFGDKILHISSNLAQRDRNGRTKLSYSLASSMPRDFYNAKPM